jgi:hypothetical protein
LDPMSRMGAAFLEFVIDTRIHFRDKIMTNSSTMILT